MTNYIYENERKFDTWVDNMASEIMSNVNQSDRQ